MASPRREVLGVIHLPRLPSSDVKPEYTVEQIADQAVKEARILEELGYSGVIVENYGDYPYRKRVRDPVTLVSMAVVVREVVRSTGFKVGVNMLRNSGKEAYSIALASGAKFIRVNALIEPTVSDCGILEPEAPRLRALRMNYPNIEVYADIMVKHAISLRTTLATIEASSTLVGKGSLEDYVGGLVEEYIDRGMANALVVTGLKTGDLPPLDLVKLIKRYSKVPVLVGSGVTADNVDYVLKYAEGVIVGSFIKKDGRAGNRVDPERARLLIRKIASLNSS